LFSSCWGAGGGGGGGGGGKSGLTLRAFSAEFLYSNFIVIT